MATPQTWKGKKKPNPIKHGKRAKAYKWNDRERDPEMLFLIERAENDQRSNYSIANDAYLSPGTVTKIVDGVTRRPMNSTITFLANALGYRRAFVGPDGKPTVVPLWEDRIEDMKAKLAEKADAAPKKNGKD